MEAQVGDFQYYTDSEEENEGLVPDDSSPKERRINRRPQELSDGVIYFGQWNNKGCRDGRGIQIWKDGSKYVGNFMND